MLPILYRDIDIQDETNLLKLSSLLLMLAPDDPRRTWMKDLRLMLPDIRIRDETHRTGYIFEETYEDINIVLLRSRLQRFTLVGTPTPEGLMAVLAELHTSTLTSLNIGLNLNCPRSLCMIPTLPNLRSLGLVLCSPAPLDTFWAMEAPPLDIPRLETFSWEWDSSESDDDRVALAYLARCRFSPTCRFDIYGVCDDSDEAAIPNPLFLAHRNRLITIHLLTPPTCTILQNASAVHFRECAPAPHPDLFRTSRLPPIIIFKFLLGYPQQNEAMATMWRIFDLLAKSEHTYDTCLVVHSTSGPHRLPLAWKDSCEAVELTPAESEVLVQMMRSSELLAPRGITVCDGTGCAWKSKKGAIVQPAVSLATTIRDAVDFPIQALVNCIGEMLCLRR